MEAPPVIEQVFVLLRRKFPTWVDEAELEFATYPDAQEVGESWLAEETSADRWPSAYFVIEKRTMRARSWSAA